jgi:hypothetical protein
VNNINPTDARAQAIWAAAPDAVRLPPPVVPTTLNRNPYNHLVAEVDWTNLEELVLTPTTLIPPMMELYDSSSRAAKRDLYGSLYDDFNQVSEELSTLKRIVAQNEAAIEALRLQARDDSLRLRNFRRENDRLARDFEVVREQLHQAHVEHADCESKLLIAGSGQHEQLQERFNQMKERMDQVEDALRCNICLLPMHDTTQRGCGHVTCQGCSQEWEKQKSGCPTCRKVHWYRGRNWTIENLAETVFGTKAKEEPVETEL